MPVLPISRRADRFSGRARQCSILFRAIFILFRIPVCILSLSQRSPFLFRRVIFRQPLALCWSRDVDAHPSEFRAAPASQGFIITDYAARISAQE